MAVFRGFSCLARPLQNLGHPPGGPAGVTRKQTMTLSTAKLQNVVASLFGALLVSSLFISAASSVPLA